ncbi:MAG: thymidine phosphorylase [Acidobacteria bacterium RIFCSPLOWO2_12_FULL_67_14]|nr:MAG: thymidine phosphorylase [Acidobacteria bacterium RIFCSPLOWO2_12_FULL_67_14]
MSFVDVIAKKRDGHALAREDIDRFVSGVTAADIPDYQASALLMAIVLRGMSAEETSWLTDAMVRSGERVDLSEIPGIKVGKHSTGGVGDKVSIILAPLAAACGVVVPKMSGRGLGHTGGTLDKLESIPGYRTNLTIDEFKGVLRHVGTSIIGQSASLAPADKHLYALRDVTATVESIPLIAASVMSKKLAEGGNALVLDVKCGQGAFMRKQADATELARMLVAIGSGAGVRTEALITAMDAPLGRAVGNAVEVIECIEVLKGRGPEDLIALVTTLAARVLVLSGLSAEQEAGGAIARALSSGAALERLRMLIEAQGGDARVIDEYGRLASAARRRAIAADRDGYVDALQADLIGRASMALGAGRQRVGDRIDHGAGILIVRKPGEAVRAGDTIVELVYNAEHGIETASALAQRAIRITPDAPVLPPLVLGRVA